jgi:lactoylglutathione lyase
MATPVPRISSPASTATQIRRPVNGSVWFETAAVAPRTPPLRPFEPAEAVSPSTAPVFDDLAVLRTRMRAVAEYLHTMVRITDPEKSRAFYEALGFTFSRDMDIVRNGEREATNYFYSLGDQENVLELTFNHDGRTYDLGDAYGHIAIAVDDLEQSLGELKGQGIEPEREPYRVRDGGSLICFVRDPDGYRVELIDRSGK